LAKNKIIAVFLTLHLIIILLGTSLVDFARVPAILHAPISYYLALTGGNPYSFFSPDIPTQIVVDCYMTDISGRVTTEHFDRKSNTFQLRANYLFQILANDDDTETAAQIASGYCFRKHPAARYVRVSISRFIVPSIQDYKQVTQCSFSELYSKTYTNDHVK